MKRLLLCCLWLVATVGAIAQVPSFKSFNTNQFSTNNFIVSIKDGALMTNITVRNSITLPSGPGSEVTLTNVYSLSYWTNIATVLQPGGDTVINSVQVTNLTAFQTLASAGAFVLDATLATTLSLGTNCVSALQEGGLALSGPTSDPADTTFNIDGGNFSGHLMFILNASNNSGFTFLNGSAFCDGTPGAFVRLNGDWITQTRGDGLLLYNFNGNLWTEVGRFSGSTNIITGDNVWENVLAGNIQPVHGNENNVLHFTSGLDNNSTNIAMRVGTTNLWDASGSLLAAFHNAGTNQALIGVSGGIYSGKSTLSLQGPMDDSTSFYRYHDVSQGDSVLLNFKLGVMEDSNFNNGTEITVQPSLSAGTTNAVATMTIAPFNTVQFPSWTLKGGVGNQFATQNYFAWNDSAIDRLKFNPSVASSGTAVAHFLDTSNVLADGDMVTAFRVAGTNVNRVTDMGGMLIGKSIEARWNPDHSDILSGWWSEQYGEPETMYSLLGAGTSAGSVTNSAERYLELNRGNGSPGSFDWHLRSVGTGSESVIWNFNGEWPDSFFKFRKDGTDYMKFEPPVASSGSSVAYFLDTSNTLTNGDKSLSIRNAGTEQLNISPVGGGVLVGPNANAFWGGNADAATLVGAKVTSLGDGDFNQIFVGTSLTASGVDQGQVFSLTQTNRAENSVFVYESSNPFSLQTVVDLTGSGVDAYVQYDADGSVIMKLHPTVTSSGTAVAYTLGTSNVQTNGDTFLSLRNAGTPIFQFAPAEAGNPAGQIIFGPGTTNVLYRSGEHLIYTNGTATGYSFRMPDPGGSGRLASFGVLGGGSAKLSVGAGQTIALSPNNESVSFVAQSGAFGPNALSQSLGTSASTGRWLNLHLDNNIAWNGTTNNLIDTWGTATPEGAETAFPSSLFRDASTGTVYVKASGTGNTGWLPLATTGTGASQQTEYLDADETNNSTTPDALALSATVTAAGKYAFTLTVFVDNSTDADGACIDFDGGDATMTSFRAQTKVFDTALGLSSNSTALATDLCVATLTGAGSFEVSGGFTVNAGGTFIPRFFMNADSGGTLTAFQNSTLIVTAAN